MDYTSNIKTYIDTEIKTLQAMDLNAISHAMNLIMEAYETENNIYIFGNGGSSSTSSHFANDFNKGLSERLEKKFKFISLCDNMATILAIANDISFDEIFRYQLVGRIKKGDIIIAISGSGNSKNVINAVEYAKEQNIKVIGLTGYNGGKVKEICDISLHVPINSMQITEDLHMMLDHLIMSIFYKTLSNIDHIRQ